ncbi:MAG: DUF1549 and DUF1553 domain-containing protein [Verrucomicrobiota bacterium]
MNTSSEDLMKATVLGMTKKIIVIASLGSTILLNLGFAKISTEQASRNIDELVEAKLESKGVERNSEVRDEVFVRRIYLDIMGRIPTYDEALKFLNSDDQFKRQKLIDALLQSEGHISHFFHLWADLLRLKTRTSNGNVTGLYAYTEWVKQSLRDNKPYDQLVRELITATGYPWENPAVGFYLRDFNMPLDHMSSTVQTFLGTRMQCAQCHDHPFDSWTQMDYYKMAAFTYNVRTRVDIRQIEELKKYLITLKQKKDGIDVRKLHREPARRQMVRELLQPLQIGAIQTERKLRLPEDYQYNNAEPKQIVEPMLPFAEEGQELTPPQFESAEELRNQYANWMTSPTNPRFSKVIVNRLWKYVLGLGLIEPLDDFTDDTEASNPELLDYLASLMIENQYDMREFLRVLYNTKTYQSASSLKEEVEVENYLFAGPLLRRMSAEQIWDSIWTLVLEDVDERKGGNYNVFREKAQEESMMARAYALQSMETEVMYELLESVVQVFEKRVTQRHNLHKSMQSIEESKQRDQLNKQLRSLQREARKEVDQIIASAISPMIEEEKDMTISSMSMDRGGVMSFDSKQRKILKETDPRWKDFHISFVRAAELQSPMYPGHFLRQFGQSDREIIDNADKEASVPQALTLMNSQYLQSLIRRESLLTRNVMSAEEPGRKAEIMFMSFLAREPSQVELEAIVNGIEGKESAQAYRMVVTALLNSQEFRFIQ